MPEFLFVVGLTFFMVGIGFPGCSLLGRSAGLTLVEQTLAGFLVGALAVGFAVWAVGSITYSVGSMWVVTGGIGAMSLPGLWAWVRRVRQRDHCAFSFTRSDTYLWLLIGGLAGATVVGGFAPPADSDPVRYHLLIPKRDFELGRIQAIYGWSIYEFFPSLLEMLYRLGLAVTGPRTAHFIHSSFTFAAAAGTWALARRMGMARNLALLAVALFLSIRIVIYQAATADVDQAMIATFVMLLILALAWRDTEHASVAVLMGLIGGVLLNIKYTGIPLLGVLGLVLLIDTAIFKRPLKHLVMLAMIAAALLLPLLLRNAALTGNPLFPLYNDLFGSDRLDLLAGTEDVYTVSRGLVDFLLIPFSIFLSPGSYDGFQFGGVMLLVFAPLAWIGRKNLNGAAFLCAVLAAFMVVWYLVMTQQVRFMQPIFPVLAAFAAFGAGMFWRLTKSYAPARGAFLVLCALLVVNQALFLGGTAVRRLPVAVGLIPEQAYLTSPPYIQNTHVEACRFLENKLNGEGRYISLLNAPSFYCPQGALMAQVLDEDLGNIYTSRPLRPIAAPELADIFASEKIRWVIADKKTVERRKFQSVDFFRDRFGDPLIAALAMARPRLETATARVFAVSDIRPILRRTP